MMDPYGNIINPIPQVMKVKIITEGGRLPESSNRTDAGYDIYALGSPKIKYVEDSDGNSKGVIQYIEYRTGIAIEPPTDHHVEIFPRSSISKYDLVLANSIGLIDEGYRNEILVRFKYIEPNNDIRKVRNLPKKIYQNGDRIAQLVIRKTERFEFVQVEELSDTQRGMGGWGSSGR